jgi:acylphosphatase
MVKAFTGRISGRVQGVGYRYFAEKCAHEHGVKGWVRNAADGSVEITAAGETDDLERFLVRLKRGPFPSCVESLDIEWLKEAPAFNDFRITG